VVMGYLHNDAFPSSHVQCLGPLGYQGSKAAMMAIREADVVLALGSRLNPFGTLPQYGIDYWPKDAKIIQVEIDPKRLNLVKQVDLPIHSDIKSFSIQLLNLLQQKHEHGLFSSSVRQKKLQEISSLKQNWKQEINNLSSSNPNVISKGKIKPRTALSILEKCLPDNVIVSTDIGNICSLSNTYLNFEKPRSFLAAMTFGNCGYSVPAAMGAKIADPERPVIAYVGDGAWGMSMSELLTCVREKIPITIIVFNNGQWGAEKKNQVIWFGDRYIGTNLSNPSFSDVAKSMGAEGYCVNVEGDIQSVIKQSLLNQKKWKNYSC